LTSIPIIYITFFLLFVGCKPNSTESTRPKETGEMSATVEISAGGLIPQFGNKAIPTFFNVAKMNNSNEESVSSILLGPKHSEGKKVSVEPVALLKFKNDTINYKYVICYPTDEINRSTESFLVGDLNLQNSLEEWFKAQGDFNQFRDFKWENAYKALLEID